jgi:DNA processing protein
MADTQEKIYQIALSLVQGVGATLWRRLIDQTGSAQAVFQSDGHQLMQVSGASKQLAYEILKQDTLSLAEKLFLTHQKQGIQVISIMEPAYPNRLQQTPQAPPLLYFQGTADMNSRRMISIVGTRKATHYGRKVVEKLIHELTAYQVVVISGLAYGIDIHAHQEALKQGLSTIGVLAGSLDAVYPVAHKKIAADMLAQGGLVSENPLRSGLKSHQFPARNRIIAGMADATIIIEADQKSGALITATFANAYHREVFAIPGGIDAPYSRGPNHLIKNHQAHLITNAADIAYVMGWETNKNDNPGNSPKQAVIAQLTIEEQAIIQLMEKVQTAIHIDVLARQSQIPLTQLNAALLQLELKELVQCLPGSQYKLIN